MWSSHWNWPNDRWIQVPQNTWQTLKKAYLYPIWWAGTIRIRWVFSPRTWHLQRFKYHCMCYPISFLLHESQANEKTFHQTSLMSSRNVPELIIMVTKSFKRPSNSGKANINGRRVINQRYWLRSTGISWISFTRGKLLLKLAENKIDERRSLHAMFTGVLPQTICKNIQFFLIKPKPQTWRLNELWKHKIKFFWWGHD